MALAQAERHIVPFVGNVLLVIDDEMYKNIPKIEEVSEVLRSVGNVVVVMGPLGAAQELRGKSRFDYGAYFWKNKLHLVNPSPAHRGHKPVVGPRIIARKR